MSSNWTNIPKVTSVWDGSLEVFFSTMTLSEWVSEWVSDSVSDNVTYRAVWGQLKIQKSEHFPKIWKIFKYLKIFQISENFPKFWKFSKNLKLFQKSKTFPKIWKFSKNLKISRKSENFPLIALITCQCRCQCLCRCLLNHSDQMYKVTSVFQKWGVVR